MIRASAVAGLILISGGVFAQENPTPYNLGQVYALALARSETAGIQEAEVARAESRYAQLRAAVLPLVGFNMVHRIRDEGASDLNRFDDREETSSRFYLHQPIFAGFREFAALKAQGFVQKSSEEALRQARFRLFNDVANVFYLALETESQVANLTALTEASGERVEELRRRVNIGRSRQAETLFSRSQFAALQARREDAIGQHAAAMDLLSSLAGQPIRQLLDDRSSAPPIPPLETLLSRVNMRPDVRLAEANLRAAEYVYKANRRAFWPTLVADANYYTKRADENDVGDWDAFFTLDAPIFRGGAWMGAVNVAEQEMRQAQLRRDLARRLADEEIRTLRTDLAAGLARLKYLSEASELAEQNYKVQRKEYGLGLVTNLEIIAALDGWESVRSEYDLVRLGVKLFIVRLSVATAAVPEVER